MLLYVEGRFLDQKEGRFIQAIEGEEEAIKKLYE